MESEFGLPQLSTPPKTLLRLATWFPSMKPTARTEEGHVRERGLTPQIIQHLQNSR